MSKPQHMLIEKLLMKITTKGILITFRLNDC
jgi:hypothetical protein